MATFTLPPQMPISFDHTPENLIPLTHEIIASTIALQDKIVTTITPENATFTNTILPLLTHENKTLNQNRHFKFYNSTHPLPSLREASHASNALFLAADTATLIRSDLGLLVAAVYARADALAPEDQTSLPKLHAAFQRNRLGKSARFVEINKRVQELLAFNVKSINATAGAWLTREDLDGLPTATLESLQEEEGKVFLPFKKPHYELALQWVESSAVRKHIFIGNDNRCPENPRRLKEILMLKEEAAGLLGYGNHAELKMEEKMIKSKKFVDDFIEDFTRKITPIAKAQIGKLMELRREEFGRELTDDENHFFIWDSAYYRNLEKRKLTAFDEKSFSEYLELGKSLEGMMDIFSHLFGMRFEKILPEQYDAFGAGHVTVWHESVTVFTVWNDESQGDEFLGYLYLDLFPRPDKYNHAGQYGLQQGYIKPDGSRHYPAGALVMNFQTPTASNPCLLKPDQARSLFHELGHAIHNLTTRTQYASNHTSVPRDFVEIPSIFLENWLWTPSVLKSIGMHYSYLSPEFYQAWKDQGGEQQPEKILPNALIAQLIGTRRIGEAITVLGQLFISAFDMKVHGSTRAELEAMNLAETWNRMNAEITGRAGAEVLGKGWEWGNGFSRIGMMVRSYDAGVYVYALSKAYAQDLFVTMFEKDPMDREVGLRYRKIMLEPGSSKDGMEMMTEFLGRMPNADARSKELGFS